MLLTFIWVNSFPDFLAASSVFEDYSLVTKLTVSY